MVTVQIEADFHLGNLPRFCDGIKVSADHADISSFDLAPEAKQIFQTKISPSNEIADFSSVS